MLFIFLIFINFTFALDKFANKAVHQTAGSHKNQSKQQMKSSALSHNNIKTPTDTNNLLKSADGNTLKRSLARTRTLTSSTDESEDECEFQFINEVFKYGL